MAREFYHDGDGVYYRKGSYYHLPLAERNQVLQHDPKYPKVRRLQSEISLGMTQLQCQNTIIRSQAQVINRLEKVSHLRLLIYAMSSSLRI